MAELNNWKSIEDYDDELKKIEHYKKHNEMLPYIGKHYKQARILLVGESHYVNNIEYNVCDWYNEGIPSDLANNTNNFNTRYVVERFLNKDRSKAHSMFRNPAKGLLKALDLTSENITDSEAFSTFAFMNFFQRPEMSAGKSLNFNDCDVKHANDVVKSVVEIIKPRLIVFLSQKAFDKLDQTLIADSEICAVSHPTCPHWYGGNGLDKFINALNKTTILDEFDRYKPLKENEVNIIIKNIDRFKLVRKKSFNKDVINCKLISSDNELNEIIWYFNGAYGIGYLVKYNVLWIWNYKTKSYVDENDPNVSKIYNEIKEFIENKL